MAINTPYARTSALSIAAGFAILLAVYHFHEFFQSLTVSGITLLTFLVISHFVARAQHLEGIKSWGLSLSRNWWVKLLLGLALGVLFVGLSTAASLHLGYEKITAVPTFSTFIRGIWWILFMIFWPSLAEDILTRGYLFRHLGKRMPAYTWVIFSATVYVLNHIWRLSDHPAVLTYLFILGLVLATAIQLTKSLWLTLGIHWAANIVYYFSVNMLSIESVADANHQSTWVLAAAYLLLFLVMLAAAAFLKNQTKQVTDKLTDFA
ncbi:lysostaphin resistance A-like protein [Pontibacter sp. MBLB2868]|uniref:CPBP family intramembrane glutamic endopeptidase n=1 Tax=Pontibacter sp. MBLB2868 TaxID=3451555 RepID=UPI003F74BB8B